MGSALQTVIQRMKLAILTYGFQGAVLHHSSSSCGTIGSEIVVHVLHFSDLGGMTVRIAPIALANIADP